LKSKRGRKPAAETISDDIKARMSVSVASHNVSLRNADLIALLWMSKYDNDVNKYKKLGLSRSTTWKIIMNVYGRVLRYICYVIVRSKKLTILIDGTSDRKSRNPLAIRMTGIDPENHNKEWSYPLFFCEPGDHSAATQCLVISSMLKDISVLADHTPELTLLDIDAIVFDSTSPNTGMNFGLAGLIIKERKILFASTGKSGEVPLLIIHKCEDHILNLMSSDFEELLIKKSPGLQVSKKHRATDVVQFLVAKVCFFN
jgi:hypothetical protein